LIIIMKLICLLSSSITLALAIFNRYILDLVQEIHNNFNYKKGDDLQIDGSQQGPLRPLAQFPHFDPLLTLPSLTLLLLPLSTPSPT
jgi:hypothetical protein